MCRNATIALVLAALFATSANGSPATPAAGHKRTASAAASPHPHSKAQRPAAPVGRRPAGHASQGQRPAAHKQPLREDPHAASIEHPRPRPAIKAGTPATPATRGTAGRPAVARATSLSRTRVVVPPPLRGSYASLVRQNDKSEAEGLERIEDDEDLDDRIARKLLVPVPVSAMLTINTSLPQDKRYCRPWTARFLSDLVRAHAAVFHRPLTVSSAVRTVESQKRLMETNGNAAPAEGDVVSPHLTGATIDLAKQDLGRKELAWMRTWLLPLETTGKIDVEEEFQQTCFHITVYKSYVPAAPARTPGPKPSRPAPSAQIASRGR